MKLKIKPLLFFFCFSMISISHCQKAYLTNDVHAKIISDSSGIYLEDYKFSPSELFPKKKWEGEWIWLNELEFKDYKNTSTAWINNDKEVNQYKALFRKEFEIKELPSLAVLCITADVSFRAYLNGNFVCQGPANIGSDYEDTTPPEHWFFTTHDLRKYLRTGKNVIAVEVYSFDLALSETTSGEGKFICDLNVDLNNSIVSTDSTWKCNIDTSLSRVNEGFIYNAEMEITDWQKNIFDDRDWTNASIINTIKSGYLFTSQIPTTIRYPLLPVGITEGTNNNSSTFEQLLKDNSFKFDFGKNILAYYTLSLTAHKGDTVKIYPSEKFNVNRPLIYICREGKNYFTTPYLSVFRYLTVDVKSQKGLKIDSLYALYSSYPVSYRGSFSCSDTFYTKLWDIIRWTTQMCMNSLYLDSPMHQEPLACTGDYLIESLSNYYAFGDPWLARQDLIKTARMLKKNDYDMFHTSYSLLWVQMLCNYFQYTGDTLLVKELLPHINKLNELFAAYLDENFLLSQAPDYMFMDWIKIDKFNAHHPPAVIGMGYLSAFYYKSLIDAAYLNEINNNTQKKLENLHLAEKIKSAVDKFLWDEKKEIYKDGIPFISRIKTHFWLPADEDIVTYSPHINTLAVLYDIAPESKQASIINYVIKQKEIELQPYFMYFVLSALTHIKKFDSEGLELLNKWKNGFDLETYTLKENWQDTTEFGYSGDFSHAWGGSPLYFMSSKVLGITPRKPGYKEINFTPFVSDYLVWGKGTVPLNDGNIISVSWKISGISKYIYFIEIPEGQKVILIHPDKLFSYNVRINDKTYERYEGQIILSGGNYSIEYTKMN